MWPWHWSHRSWSMHLLQDLWCQNSSLHTLNWTEVWVLGRSGDQWPLNPNWESVITLHDLVSRRTWVKQADGSRSRLNGAVRVGWTLREAHCAQHKHFPCVSIIHNPVYWSWHSTKLSHTHTRQTFSRPPRQINVCGPFGNKIIHKKILLDGFLLNYSRTVVLLLKFLYIFFIEGWKILLFKNNLTRR